MTNVFNKNGVYKLVPFPSCYNFFFSSTFCPLGTSNWQSLLLPSSSSPAQMSHLPPSSPFPVPLSSSLKSLDVHQDFHLPDDQFAYMKLLKLCQVVEESGVKGVSTPPCNTRSSIHDSAMLLPLPLSFTPTIPDPPCPDDKEQQICPQGLSTELNLTDELVGKDSTKKVPENRNAESNVVGQQLCAETENDGDCGQTKHKAATPFIQNQSSPSIRSAHRPKNCNQVDPQQNFVAGPQLKGIDSVAGRSGELKEQPAAEKQTQFSGLTSSLEDQTTRNHQVENRAATEDLFSDHSQNKSQDKPSDIPTSSQACNKTQPAQGLPKIEQCSLEEPSEPDTDLSKDRLVQEKTRCGSHGSQLVLRSPPASVNCSFITPHQASPTAASSPLLPSLGVTPLTPFPAAPPLSLPPPHSPSTQTLSPLALSPNPSIPRLPPSLPPLSLGRHTRASVEPAVSDPCHKVQPAAGPNLSRHSPGSEVQVAEETPDQCVVRHTHMLKVKLFFVHFVQFRNHILAYLLGEKSVSFTPSFFD